MDLVKVLSAVMLQLERSQDWMSLRLTYGVSGETRDIKGSLWIHAVMADYVPHTRDDQNQTIGARFQEVE